MVAMRVVLSAAGVAVAIAVATSCLASEGSSGDTLRAVAPPPDSTALHERARPALVPAGPEIERLRKASRHAVALVWCGARGFELPAPRFDSSGVWSASNASYRQPRVAIVQTSDVVGFDPPPRPIAWDTIDSIAVTSRGPGRISVFLATVGLALVAGLPIAGAIVANATHSAGSGTPSLLAIALPVAVAGVLAISFVRHHDRVSVIYRAR